ncbi:unnamed protein product [Brassica oleracea]
MKIANLMIPQRFRYNIRRYGKPDIRGNKEIHRWFTLKR